jgi:hypothetical protein
MNRILCVLPSLPLCTGYRRRRADVRVVMVAVMVRANEHCKYEANGFGGGMSMIAALRAVLDAFGVKLAI